MAHTVQRTIRSLREERGWSQRKVSVMLDIAVSTLQDWEANRKEPRIEQMRKLMDLFGLTWEQIEWPDKAKKLTAAA